MLPDGQSRMASVSHNGMFAEKRRSQTMANEYHQQQLGMTSSNFEHSTQNNTIRGQLTNTRPRSSLRRVHIITATSQGPSQTYIRPQSSITASSNIEGRVSTAQISGLHHRFRRVKPPTQETVIQFSGDYWERIRKQIGSPSAALNSGTEKTGKTKIVQKRKKNATSAVVSSRNKILGKPQLNGKTIGKEHSQIFQDQEELKRQEYLNLEKRYRAQAIEAQSKLINNTRNLSDMKYQRPFSFLAKVGGMQSELPLFNQAEKTDIFQQHELLTTYQRSQAQQNPIAKKQSLPASSIDYDLSIFTDIDVDGHEFDVRERRKVLRNMGGGKQKKTPKKANELERTISRMKQLQQRTPLDELDMLGEITSCQQSSMNKTTTFGGGGNSIMKYFEKSVEMYQMSSQQEELLQEIQKRFVNRIEEGKHGNSQVIAPAISVSKDYLIKKKRAISALRNRQLGTGSQEKDNYFAPKLSRLENDQQDDGSNDDSDIIDQEENDAFFRVIKQASLESQNQIKRAVTIKEEIPQDPFLNDQVDSKIVDPPYPELFDRSERTFAATFAKFGDLNYYTPVQRIGSYMDHTARLKKKHILDLIAYLKTAKKVARPVEDDDGADNEGGMNDYLEHCLFLGLMPEEDGPAFIQQLNDAEQQYELQEAAVRVYDHHQTKVDKGFEFRRVWSEQLMNQAKLSIRRLLRYIDSNDLIKNEEISKFNSKWMSTALELIPDFLLERYQDETKKLFSEIFNSYARSMRLAIMEYVLLSPQERKRLFILMIPRKSQTACERSLIRGGFSLSKFSGQHERKIENEEEIKVKLLINNIVTSSLQNWTQDFRSHQLIEFRGISTILKDSDQDSVHQISAQIEDYFRKTQNSKADDKLKAIEKFPSQALELQQFFAFQQSFRLKTVELLRQIWHRGCISIIKKFKFLKLKSSQGQQNNLPGKWQFSGFQPSDPLNVSKRKINGCSLDDSNDRIALFMKHSMGQQTVLQKYIIRAATILQVEMLKEIFDGSFSHYEEAKGMLKSKDLHETCDLSSLVDIRENLAYTAFVKMIGGVQNLEKNGYDILAKDYKREIKYISGNLMQLHMREIVHRSVNTVVNFFKGIPSISKLKKSLSSVLLRKVNIPPTLAFHASFSESYQPQVVHRPTIISQNTKIGSPKQTGSNSKRISQRQQLSLFDLPPQLELPEFCDLQDHVTPIFKLSLILTYNSSIQKLANLIDQDQDCSAEFKSTILSGDNISLSLADNEILSMFDNLIDNIVTSFNDFLRPEFCKVKIVTQKKYESDRDDEKRLRRQMSKQHHSFDKKKASSLANNNRENHHEERMNQQAYFDGLVKEYTNKLTNGHKDGINIYMRFFGRIQIEESEKNTKILVDEKNLGIFERPFVEKYFNVASTDEQCFMDVKNKIKKLITTHIEDAKRSIELFQQFKSVIQGSLANRVLEAFTKDYPEWHYSGLVKELRYFSQLTKQLPNIIFMPMFEVSIADVKSLVEKRVDMLMNYLFLKFQRKLIQSSQGICSRYTEIALFLKRELKTAKDILEMDMYKNNLLLEMTSLRERIAQNRSIVLFLVKNDKILDDHTVQLIAELHSWPYHLGQLFEEAEERHKSERNNIESILIKRREEFEEEIVQFEHNVKEVANYGDLYGYRLVISKIHDYNSQLQKLEKTMNELSQEEMMLFSFKSPYDAFHTAKSYFVPFYELWITSSDALAKKRQWFETKLISLNYQEVSDLIHKANNTFTRLQKHFATNKKALKVIGQTNQELSELELYLPVIETLCNQENALSSSAWNAIQQTINTNFNYTEVCLKEVKYLGLRENIEIIRAAINQQFRNQEPNQ